LFKIHFIDDKPVRPAAEVAEAAGAKYIGVVILLVICVPFGAMIIMDLTRLIGHMQQHNKPRHKPRPPRKSGRIIKASQL